MMSPPRTVTWATPPSDRSLGLMLQSAMVLRSRRDVVSERSPIIIISPRMEVCGPSVGFPQVGGREPLTSASFSETICLSL